MLQTLQLLGLINGPRIEHLLITAHPLTNLLDIGICPGLIKFQITRNCLCGCDLIANPNKFCVNLGKSRGFGQGTDPVINLGQMGVPVLQLKEAKLGFWFGVQGVLPRDGGARTRKFQGSVGMVETMVRRLAP